MDSQHALDRRAELGSTGYDQTLYGPSALTHPMGLATALTSAGIRLPIPGGGEVAFGSTGISQYRDPNWQGSQVLLSFTTQTTPTVGGAYSPFGEKYASYSGGANGYFAGMLGIADEGPINDAYQAEARLMHQAEGRWVSPDPAGMGAVDLTNPQTLNRYGYVANDPLNNIDPSGLLAPAPAPPPLLPPIQPWQIGGAPIPLCNPASDWSYTGTPGQTPCNPVSIQPGGPILIAQNGGGVGGAVKASKNFVRMPLPKNHLNCATSTGISFPAPPGFSVSNIAANGAANGLAGAGAAVGQGGYYDYQRLQVGSVTQYFPGYTPVANVAVGAYVQGTGAPQWMASLISNTYAFIRSSNGPTAQQAQFRNLGFSLAAGKATYSCHQ